MPKNKPRSIVFEGPDGVGKSTHAQLLANYLGEQAILTKEPGGTEQSDALREVLLTQASLTPTAQTTLMAISRRLTQTDIVIPAMSTGLTVVRDRSFLSSMAYQGSGGELGSNYVLLKNLGPWLVIPDLVMLFEPPALPLKEADETTFEQEGDDFKRRVREGFTNLPATIASLAEVEPFSDFRDSFGLGFADITFVNVETSLDGRNLSVEEVRQQILETSLEFLEPR